MILHGSMVLVFKENIYVSLAVYMAAVTWYFEPYIAILLAIILQVSTPIMF